MANPTTVALAARIEGDLGHHAKYCGLELLSAVAQESLDPTDPMHRGVSNAVTFALRSPTNGRVWTVVVSDPDDCLDDPEG
jgi:hypothetical protein